MVRMRGLEPPRREAPDPKSGVYTNFTTSAKSKKVVLPVRFERTTARLEGVCSIQLSYGSILMFEIISKKSYKNLKDDKI